MSVITSITSSGGNAEATVYKSLWLTATAYLTNQQVQHNNDLYLCSSDHTSASTTEPGIGANWATKWVKQLDSLSSDKLLAADGTGTPSASNPFVTQDTLDAKFNVTTGHDHDGTDSLKVTWNNINKTTSSIADIATRAHTTLSGIGTNTHTQIDSHVADATKHRQINDAGTLATELWSANKTNATITAGMTGVLSFENPVIDKDLSTPPAPVEGERYIVKPTGLLGWADHNNAIAQYVTDAWTFTAATSGMAVWVTDEDLLYLFNGTSWLPINDFVLSQTDPEDVDYEAAAPGVGSTVAKGDHTHSLKAHTHADSEVIIPSHGAETCTLEDLIHLESAGRITGGVLTDDGIGGVNVSELQCLLKTTESDTGHIVYVVIPAGNIPASELTNYAMNSIIADYNDGTPKFAATSLGLSTISSNTKFQLGRVYNDDGDLDITTGGVDLANSHRNNNDRLIQRGIERMSGVVLSEVGERYLGVTAGVFYLGAKQFTISAVNTSTTGTYTRFIRDGSGGWNTVSSLTQVSNNVYDDGSGTPAAIPTGFYAARWVYICLEGHLYICDGQDYFTLSEAKTALQPASLPDYITKNAKLIAKYIISPDEDHFVLIVSGFSEETLGTTSPSSHQGLSGLQGGAANDYYHFTGTEHTALTTNIAETVQDIAGGMFDGTDTGMTLAYTDETGKVVGAVTYGTSAATACVGNDARLSDARTPSSHTIASHTTSGASDGKILTASSATEFGWEDPATVTWEGVSGKPTTFAPTSHAISSHTTSGAAVGKVLTASSATEFAWADPAPTWTQVTSKPETFAPIIGATSTTAVAGDDSRLTDTRTPKAHTHPSTELTDYVAPDAWVPVLVWSGVAPAYAAVARYTKIGKMVTFWLAITGADGDGRKLTSVTLPLEPKNVGMTISCAGQTAAPTTRSDPYAYIVANTDVAANKLLQFYTALTFANNSAFVMNVTGQYEVA